MIKPQIIVIGGGAAGVFGALSAAEANPNADVTIIEKSPKLLTKVKVSGGGRCNVTHNCFDPKTLTEHYPRGHRELLGPFHQFNPKHTIDWFKQANIDLKSEPDGRMFPATDDSQTIIDCFLQYARLLNVKILLKTSVEKIECIPRNQFNVFLNTGTSLIADKILLASGGGQSNKGFDIAKSFGHTIIAPVPSLFTFNIKDSRINDLPGIAFPQALLTIPKTKLQSTGPLLITHWGLSGPAILKLSAWGARILHDLDYTFDLKINFLPQFSTESLVSELKKIKVQLNQKQVIKNPLFDLTKRFWERICLTVEIETTQTWNQISNESIQSLAEQLTSAIYSVHGKSTFKEEFVTCGGVSLKEVNFKTMESKIMPGLFFAGEVLDIDGITGGFNFQAAWTTSHIAGTSMNSFH